SDVCLGHTTTVSRNAASSAHLEHSRNVKVSWPVTFVLEETATAHQGPATSRHVQVNVHQVISLVMGSSPVSRAPWEHTSPTQDEHSVFPVEVGLVPKERVPAHLMTV
ncbi:hypothetical protein M9458_045714, partial [Cirrhinus mrigala]